MYEVPPFELAEFKLSIVKVIPMKIEARPIIRFLSVLRLFSSLIFDLKLLAIS